MNTESVQLRRIKIPVPHDVEVKPGDFAWGFDNPDCFSGETRESKFIHFYHCLPGDKHLSVIQVQRGQQGGERVWGWDGNEDKPTITPSILVHGLWHGYCRNGRFESC